MALPVLRGDGPQVTPYHVDPLRVLAVSVTAWVVLYLLFAVAMLAMTVYATRGWMRGER